MVVVRVRDSAGNLGTAPAVLPPVPGQVRGKPGITVRELAAQPPVVAVRAGERVAFDVDARDRAYRWDVRRVGGAQGRGGPRRRRGSGRSCCARPAAPPASTCSRSAPAARGRACRSSCSRASASKLLVVVPTASWLGVDKIDDDRDGLPNTLENGGPVEWPRAYTRLPPALAADTAPLLIFLDRAGIKYDLTSDIALARSDEPTRQPPRRDPRRLAAVDPAVARPSPAPLRRVRRARGELRHRVDAPRHADHRRRPRPPDAADADRPVRRAARAGRRPAHRGRRPHAAAADRAHGGPLARPPDRLGRHAERVRPAWRSRPSGPTRRTRSCSPPSARTSPTASARRPRPRASCRARRSRCSPPRGSARGSRSASA